MIMPLLAPASGKIHFVLPEGSVMNSGDLIATMELDDPEAITKATPYTGGFPELGPPIVHSEGVDHRFKEAYTACKNVMAGKDPLYVGGRVWDGSCLEALSFIYQVHFHVH